MVAPLVGAWVETSDRDEDEDNENVAPLVGAWVETISHVCDSLRNGSRPSWARGLKLTCFDVIEPSPAGRAPRGRVG